MSTPTKCPTCSGGNHHLRPQALASRWGTTVKTLANWRHLGKGPAYVKAGDLVFYRLADVLAFEHAHLVTVGVA